MKYLILILTTLFTAVSFARDVHVKGHYRSNGSYVQPHYRSAPDSSKLNNWSTRGNTNPYTGQEGTEDPYND